MTLAEKIIIGVRTRARFALFRFRRRAELRRLLRSAPATSTECPICGSHRSAELTFVLPNETVLKSFCRDCEHIYTAAMQTDLAHVKIVFEIDQENEGCETQRALLEETALKSGLSSGTFLDFGVGGNVSAFQRAAKSMPQHKFMGCDVYPADIPGYFNIFEEPLPLGTFDGISSYAVVEHLTDTMPAWKRFNQLLKPVTAGGGIMVHSFPSQWNLPFDDWAMKIQGHSCLFSRKSLRLLCSETGFDITRADPPRFVGRHYHAVLEFKKVRDVA
jgi:hypothetical protein